MPITVCRVLIIWSLFVNEFVEALSKPLDNASERCQRYISLSRRNSLFSGSHEGAERMALIYSLACSCRINNINTFKYFTDVLNKLADISPKAPDEVFIELLPHRWKKNSAEI